jgi:hypothetical protein
MAGNICTTVFWDVAPYSFKFPPCIIVIFGFISQMISNTDFNIYIKCVYQLANKGKYVAPYVLVEMRQLFIITSFLHLQGGSEVFYSKYGCGRLGRNVSVFIPDNLTLTSSNEGGSYSLHFSFYQRCQHNFGG